MIKTHVLLWKTIEGNRRLRVSVRARVRFLLFYSEIALTDPWCNMLLTLPGQKKYEEAMSDEHSGKIAKQNKKYLNLQKTIFRSFEQIMV